MAKFEHKPKRKVPSFSSSLLESIYHSTEESMEEHVIQNRRKNSAQVEEEIENLRRAIRIEKWMENYSTPRHLSSNSGSSTDSSTFFSETESSASKSSLFTSHKPKNTQTLKNLQMDTTPRLEGRFTRTKSKAMRIYGELKKVKEPVSPGGKIANFLNSIFSPKKNQEPENWSSIRKSKSMKDTTTCALSSRSCLSKNAFSKSVKSKRSVKFNENTITSSIQSQFVKRNIDSYRVYEGKGSRKHGLFGEMCDRGSDFDDKSCASSDLFELENIGRVGIGAYEQELPVYGTTSINSITTRLVI